MSPGDPSFDGAKDGERLSRPGRAPVTDGHRESRSADRGLPGGVAFPVDSGVLGRIKSRFAWAEQRTWRRGYVMESLENPRPSGHPYFEPGLKRYWVPSIPGSALHGTAIADDWFDVWYPELSPSPELVSQALRAETEADWRAFARAFRAEMKQPAARPSQSPAERGRIHPISQVIDEIAGTVVIMGTPAEEGGESVSAIYRLIRLKEMLNQGLFSDIEFALQRQVMIADFLRQAES